MIVIYTPEVTNRIKYTADFIFGQYFGMEYELTEKPDIAIVPENFYISYSKNKLPGFYTVFQGDLLLEKDIREQTVHVSRESDIPVFFQTSENNDLKFDIFSCIFYLLSRYEEYLPHVKDEHGRYKSSNSVLAHKEFEFSPVVETWLHYFRGELLKQQPALSFKNYQFEYQPTFDIDNAFRFLGRNWSKHPPNVFEENCIKVLMKLKEDPFDIYELILEEMDLYKLQPVFFFLLNDTGKYNSNVSPLSKKLHKLIDKMSDVQIGIHPSYFSETEALFLQEKELLETVSSRKIQFSRQHFLKIIFPESCRTLIKSGIQTDFTLSYPDVSGFRAGYSRAFFFFDLEKDETTSLQLQPSCWMDATFEYYQQKEINEIKDLFLTIFNQLKKINGKLVPIFHNDLLAMELYWGVFKFINQQVNLRE